MLGCPQYILSPTITSLPSPIASSSSILLAHHMGTSGSLGLTPSHSSRMLSRVSRKSMHSRSQLSRWRGRSEFTNITTHTEIMEFACSQNRGLTLKILSSNTKEEKQISKEVLRHLAVTWYFWHASRLRRVTKLRGEWASITLHPQHVSKRHNIYPNQQELATSGYLSRQLFSVQGVKRQTTTVLCLQHTPILRAVGHSTSSAKMSKANEVTVLVANESICEVSTISKCQS